MVKKKGKIYYKNIFLFIDCFKVIAVIKIIKEI